MIPTQAVEAAHGPLPKWSVLYDTYQCAVCRSWIYRDAKTGEWMHRPTP